MRNGKNKARSSIKINKYWRNSPNSTFSAMKKSITFLENVRLISDTILSLKPNNNSPSSK